MHSLGYWYKILPFSGADWELISSYYWYQVKNIWRKVENNILDLAKVKVKCVRGKCKIESAVTAEKIMVIYINIPERMTRGVRSCPKQ